MTKIEHRIRRTPQAPEPLTLDLAAAPALSRKRKSANECIFDIEDDEGIIRDCSKAEEENNTGWCNEHRAQLGLATTKEIKQVKTNFSTVWNTFVGNRIAITHMPTVQQIRVFHEPTTDPMTNQKEEHAGIIIYIDPGGSLNRTVTKKARIMRAKGIEVRVEERQQQLEIDQLAQLAA